MGYGFVSNLESLSRQLVSLWDRPSFAGIDD
jgi:hypothetical protein